MKKHFRALAGFWHAQYGHYVFITAVAFAAIIVLSYAAGRFAPEFCNTVATYFARMIDSAGIMDENGSISVVALFFNNVRAMVLSVLYGFIPFIFLPALSLGVNAVILGVLAAYYSNNGFSLLLYLAGILPHGIFELPALLLSLAAGLCLCKNINTYIRKNEKGVMKPLMLHILRVVCLLVLPLLAVAAVLESYVTPLVMQLFM